MYRTSPSSVNFENIRFIHLIRLSNAKQTRKSAPRVNPQSGELLDDETDTISEVELILDRELPTLHPTDTTQPQPTDA